MPGTQRVNKGGGGVTAFEGLGQRPAGGLQVGEYGVSLRQRDRLDTVG
jgi:hypothetical protein